MLLLKYILIVHDSNFKGLLISEDQDFDHIQILRIGTASSKVIYYVPFPGIIDHNHTQEDKINYLYKIAIRYAERNEEIAFSGKLADHLASLPKKINIKLYGDCVYQSPTLRKKIIIIFLFYLNYL